ncbi:AAA family ATPase [Halorubellus litoreus]|uniref:AAA family ATPase n=1 Tax=Halorubellus litoreus TaxID=755308 RepID=A0ABD5VHR7_9EURY
MNNSSEESYSLEDVKDDLDVLRAVEDRVVDAIEAAETPEVLEYLIREQQFDLQHEGDQGVGKIRRAVLQSSKASQDLKRTVITRGDDTPARILVPDEVERNAKTALRTGKPVVLYGPTGTGKTTFAKQLALGQSVGYSLHTATPSWTAKDIIGGIGPNLSGSSGYQSLNYQTELGAVSEAVKRARDFDIPYSVILDEITRADISQIFGPLYTAIENRNQTLIETDDGETIELDEDVSIICTMNMSDRTVNELDNAITRRFAMVELDEYEDDDRRELFDGWLTDNLGDIPLLDNDDLLDLFEADYDGINNGSERASRGPIMRFGPMHYRDVTIFLREALQDESLYMDEPEAAVGQAFRTFIVPRLLNSAAFPQIEQIEEHYRALNKSFEMFDLTPAAELASRELEAEQRRMGSYEQ